MTTQASATRPPPGAWAPRTASALALVAIAVAALLIAERQRDDVEAQAQARTEAVADARAAAVASWRDERIADGRSIAAHPLVARAALALSGPPAGSEPGDLAAWARSRMQRAEYVGIGIVSSAGRVLVSQGVPVDPAHVAVAERVSRDGPALLDPHRDATGLHLDVIAPLRIRNDAAETLVGAAILRIDPAAKLLALVHGAGAAEPEARAVLLAGAAGEPTCFPPEDCAPADVQDLAVARSIPGSRWTLSLSVPRRILDARVRARVAWVLALAALVMGAVAAAALLWRRYQAAAFRAQTREAEGLEAQLLMSDRLAALGVLAAGVTHEINNPLAYVVANLGFARDELRTLLGPPAPGGAASRDPSAATHLAALREALDDARDGAERVRQIVRDLRTLSRADDEPRAVNVPSVLEAALAIARHDLARRARVVERIAAVPPVKANEGRLGQVFLNLLVNAAQAIPEGDPERHEVRVATALDADGRVAIEIADTGCGISSENLERIFDPFFTTKPVGVGTGLGLSISQRIVSAAGGEIRVRSEPGRGSTFCVLLPPVAEAVC